jgi:predicted adenylyl cyclase CyaB
MENIEFKARLSSIGAAVKIAEGLNAKDCGNLLQTDTYFHTPTGRLKIRQIGRGPEGQLVAYDRPDRPEARSCDYDLVHVPLASDLIAALARTLGIRTVVRKTRRLFLWKNIRIHLDRVDDLGIFLEFEAVIGEEDDPEQARRDLERLRAEFSIAPEDILPKSYCDMVEQRQETLPEEAQTCSQ